MGTIWILTIVLMASTTNQNRAMTSFVVEYSSRESCLEAGTFISKQIKDGNIVLNTCTKK